MTFKKQESRAVAGKPVLGKFLR